MKKYILPIMLAASLLMPVTMSAEPRGNNNNRSNTERTTTNHHRQSGSTGRPGGNSNTGRPTNNGQSRPGGNNNLNSNRPGNNKNDKKGHDKNQGNYRPNNGGNSHNRPGRPAHRPNTAPPAHSRPGGHGPGWRPGSSAVAPGNNRPHNHPPRLGYMVNHAMRGGRYDNVWMVAPGQYAVRYMLNGLWYMQYIWPETGVYGTPFRVVMNAPGQWYAYGNRNQWYYDDGPSLRISLNGTPQTPWTLVPSIELNINL